MRSIISLPKEFRGQATFYVNQRTLLCATSLHMGEGQGKVSALPAKASGIYGALPGYKP